MRLEMSNGQNHHRLCNNRFCLARQHNGKRKRKGRKQQTAEAGNKYERACAGSIVLS